MRFPIAAPHAAAGPNRMPKNTGSTFAGRMLVSPGSIVNTLNGMSSAAYTAATTATSITIRVSRHIVNSSRMERL
jgi:hypothetical protein